RAPRRRSCPSIIPPPSGRRAGLHSWWRTPLRRLVAMSLLPCPAILSPRNSEGNRCARRFFSRIPVPVFYPHRCEAVDAPHQPGGRVQGELVRESAADALLLLLA